ncbi:MAG: GNAT family N-acetyltransferase, partial [Planctomycetaceae bacterium]|nr:GNAT family N-acetyltransferase [Planctomycetaceae bacterium]
MNKSGHQNSQRIDPGRVRLRAVCREDLPALYEFQCEPEAVEMAGFPARDHDAFMAHWDRLLSNSELVTMSVTVDDTVVGHIGSWIQDGERLVGYWIGQR